MDGGITFESLCGKHLFGGCDLLTEEVEGEDCNVCFFKIDGVVYKAIENPDDGYRSYCRELQVTTETLKHGFDDIEVFIHKMEDDSCDKHDVMIMRDFITGKIILEVGTKCIDDYYPGCHFRYIPENMSCNQGGNDV